MIRRERLRIIYTCDNCGQVRRDQDGQHTKWRAYPHAWKDAQEAGWTAKAKPDGKDWDHFCPECSPQILTSPK